MTYVSVTCFLFVFAALAGVLAPLAGFVEFAGESLVAAGRALFGSAQVVTLALVVGAPAGVLSGVAAAEVGGWAGRLARLAAELLATVPGIVLGVAAYAVVILGVGAGARTAGAAALACVVAPTVARSTRELLGDVPPTLRDVALSLGVSRHRVVLLVLLRRVRPGLFGAVLSAAARALGEAAPVVLFTSVASAWTGSEDDVGVAALSTEVFALGSAAGAAGYGRASLMALVLTGAVCLFAILGRLAARRSA